MSKTKILAIKFKFLGDVAVVVPALRALHEHWPAAELHLLVAADAAPIVQNLPWLHRVWALPRTRGKARLSTSWPILRALQREHFDRSVDFVGNDRGAILSRLIGARERLGVVAQQGNLVRRLAYTRRIEEADPTRHEVVHDLLVLSAWDVPFPAHPRLETRADPALAAKAEKILPGHPLLFHLSTSQPKKELPLANWADLYQRAHHAHLPVVFSTGPSAREQAQLIELRKTIPHLPALPPDLDLALFLAVLARARLFVSPDTAPLHLAAGLGVPTIGLFGPTAASRWAPLGPAHQHLQGSLCPCSGHWHQCRAAHPCIAAIHPDAVWTALQKSLASP
ncbi:MAG: glycosyltransferase family 9 protein [Opitutales bacterium]